MARQRDNLSQSDAHNARGIELADRGWLDEAASEFQKAINLDPNSPHAHDNLGTILAEKGQYLEALREYLRALDVAPDSATPHHYLASFLLTHGHALAIQSYRAAIDTDYEFAEAHLNLAMALAETGRLKEALSELEIAHSQDPQDEHIQHELACCLIDLERFPDAIAHLKSIVKNHPEHVEAYVDLGIAYTAQGFYAQAEDALQKATEIDTYDFASHYQLAALYATWEKRDDAFKHLEHAAGIDHNKLRSWLYEDRLFDGLRQEADFLSILEGVDD